MATSIAVKDKDGNAVTVATLDAVAALLGEVQASPTANTLLDRLKQLHADMIAATPAGTNSIGAVTRPAAATGGYTPGSYVAAASANQDSTVIKASAGTLGALTVMSVVAGLRYLKVYDKATAPTSADTPKLRIPIPASTTGAGVSLTLPSQGLAFASGIAFRVTTGIADADANAATAGDCAVNYGYA